MSNAKCFQRLSRAVKVFESYFLNRCVQGVHSFRCFHPNEPQRNNGGWDEAAEEANTLGRASNSVFELFGDPVFDETEVMNYFGNAPFAFCGLLRIKLRIKLGDCAEQFLVDSVQPSQNFLHRSN